MSLSAPPLRLAALSAFLVVALLPSCKSLEGFVSPASMGLGQRMRSSACRRKTAFSALLNENRPKNRQLLQMAVEKDKDKASGGVEAAAMEEDLYFATKVSEKGNAQMFFQLVRNQLILAFSCAWTLSVIDPQSDPTFFSKTTFDISLLPLLLGAALSAPLVAGGLAISRSESRQWIEINASTNQLALRLFGSKRALAAVAVSSSLLGIITGAAEELR